MVKFARVVVLASLSVVLLATGVSAEPIDPIVRVRGGGTSIPIFGLPFEFDFGTFPADPDGDGTDCFSGPGSGPDEGFTVVSCGFQNLTGQSISLLDFSFAIPPNGELIFAIEDPDEFFDNEEIGPGGALFAGGGIPSGFCDEIEGCFGGEFIIDLVGFPDGSMIQMTASQVPEPAAVLLLGAAMAGAALRRRRNG
jgi:hypothetical protein